MKNDYLRPRITNSSRQYLACPMAGLESILCIEIVAKAAFIIVLAFFVTASLKAQIPAPSIPDNGPNPSSPLGIPPRSSSAGTNEAISYANGSLNVYIPLLSVPQRGGYSMFLGLVHHSNSLTLVQTTNVSASPYKYAAGKWLDIDNIQYYDRFGSYDRLLEINLPRLQFSYEYVGDHPFTYSDGSMYAIGTIFCATNFTFTDWSGNKHPFENVSTCNWHLGGPNTPMINLTDSSDASFYRLDTSTQSDIKVYSKDGTVYHFYGFSNRFPDNGTNIDQANNQENYYDSRAGAIVDPNGNTISITTSQDSNFRPVYQITDTLNRGITVTSSSVSYTDSNGNSQSINITATPSDTTSVNSGLACHYNGPAQNPPYITPKVNTTSTLSGVASSTTITVAFPGGNGGGAREYTLTFDALSRMTQIAYPYGGYTRYHYGSQWGSVFMGNVACSNAVLGGVDTKYECFSSNSSSCSEVSTTYKGIVASGLPVPYFSSMTITDFLGTQEEHLFSTTNPLRTNPQETDVNIKDSKGVKIRNTHNTYPSITQNPTGAGYVSFDFNFPTLTTTTWYDVTPNITSGVQYTYQPYAALPTYQSGIIDNPTEVDTIDYTTGSIASTYSGPYIKKTSFQWKAASSFTSSPHILDRLDTKTTTDSSGSNSSTISYGYDTAGNITSKTVSGTNASALTTQYVRGAAYNQVSSVLDANNKPIATIKYDDAYSSSACGVPSGSSGYPTSITDAIGHTASYTYNPCSGTVASVKDPNGVTTSYSYDALARVTDKTIKDSTSNVAAETGVTYVDSAPSTITTSVSQSSTQSVSTITTLDGFGRTVQTSLSSDPYGSDLTDTTYDALGRVQSVSNPYRTTSDSTYGITSYSYDLLGRKLNVCHPDNSTSNSTTCTPTNDYASWSYLGNTTTYQDENTNTWTRTTDALGRLLKVLEPDGSSHNATMETDYSYDALDNLTNVTQCASGCSSSGAVTRSFTYNGFSQLITATNPESGTVCYGQWSSSKCVNGYDAHGNLLYKTDARGVLTSYSYDLGNRILSKTFSDKSTPWVCFQYDSVSPNGIGRLSKAWTQQYNIGACPSSAPSSAFFTMRSILAYDALGRPTESQQQQCTPAGCAAPTPYSVKPSYDFAGNLTGLTNESGANKSSLGLTYSFDGAGHLKTVTSDWGAYATSLYSLGDHGYGPVGPISWTLGPVLSLSQGYTNTLRVNSITATGQVP